MRVLSNLRTDWLKGWRSISVSGKMEYAFVLVLALCGMAACLYVLYYSHILPLLSLVRGDCAMCSLPN